MVTSLKYSTRGNPGGGIMSSFLLLQLPELHHRVCFIDSGSDIAFQSITLQKYLKLLLHLLTFSPNLPFSLILIKSPNKQVSYLMAAWFNFLFFSLPLMFLATLTLRELPALYKMPPLTHIQFPLCRRTKLHYLKFDMRINLGYF